MLDDSYRYLIDTSAVFFPHQRCRKEFTKGLYETLQVACEAGVVLVHGYVLDEVLKDRGQKVDKFPLATKFALAVKEQKLGLPKTFGSEQWTRFAADPIAAQVMTYKANNPADPFVISAAMAMNEDETTSYRVFVVSEEENDPKQGYRTSISHAAGHMEVLSIGSPALFSRLGVWHPEMHGNAAEHQRKITG